MVQNVSNQQLLKLLFNMKQEMSSYKKETNKKISNLENQSFKRNNYYYERRT